MGEVSVYSPISGTTSLTPLPVKYICEVPETRRLCQMQVDELLTIAAHDSVGLSPDLQTAVRGFWNHLRRLIIRHCTRTWSKANGWGWEHCTDMR
jgi:hypothetical protein